MFAVLPDICVSTARDGQMFSQHAGCHGHDRRRIGECARRLGQIMEKAKVFFALAEGQIRPLALRNINHEADTFVRIVLERGRAQQNRNTRTPSLRMYSFSNGVQLPLAADSCPASAGRGQHIPAA